MFTCGHVSIPLAILGNLASPSTPCRHAGLSACHSRTRAPDTAGPQVPPPRSGTSLRQRYSL